MNRVISTIVVAMVTYNLCWGQKPVLVPPIDSGQIRLLHDTARLFMWKSEQQPTKSDLYLDSALNVLKTSLTVAERLNMRRLMHDIYWRIGAVYFYKQDDQEGKRWIRRATSGAQEDHDELDEADALYGAARIIPNSAERITYLDSVLQIAIRLYKINNEPEKEAKSIRVAAEHHFKRGWYSQSEPEYLKVIEIFHRLKIDRTVDLYLRLSAMNRYNGNFNKSISYALQSLKLNELGKDTIRLHYLYGELALVYDGLGQINESIKWYRKALIEREKFVGFEGTFFMFRTAGFLIDQLIKNKEIKEANILMKNLLAKYRPQKHCDRAIVAQILGHCYEAGNEYKIAEHQYIESIKQWLSPHLPGEFDEMTAMAYRDMGSFYLRRHDFEKAIIYLNKALDFHPGILGIVMQKDVQIMLFTADSTAGRYLSAISHYRQYNILNDSLFNDRKSKQIEEIQIQYETEKKEKEIILLNEKSRSQETQIQKSAIIRNFIFLGIILAGSFFYYRYRSKQRTNQRLELQQVEINKKNGELLGLLDEKEWLLREIHHRVKNNLQIIMALLESQSTYLESDSPALKAIQDSQHRVHSMSLIHKKLYKSDNVSKINMVVYIHELIEYLRDSFHIQQQIYFAIDVDEIYLDVSQAVPLGLLMNEAITNSIKYAFPNMADARLDISMKEAGERTFLLRIADNGIGFPGDIDVSKPESLGLSLMKGLSEEIEGSFSIESDKGTTIQIQFSAPE